jgi:uncharacterized membrane protein YuzA (DUF378 family)
MKTIDTIALTLLVIGGLIWGSVGVADFNPIMWTFIAMYYVQHLLYLLFGLSALWVIARRLGCRLNKRR